MNQRFAHKTCFSEPRLVYTKIDGTAHLRDSYRLRHQVYCCERKFLSAADFPNAEETDAFDDHALHFGALTNTGEMIGTVRLVRYSPLDFPIRRFCDITSDEFTKLPLQNVAEISRLAFSKSLRIEIQRAANRDSDGRDSITAFYFDMVIGLYRVMYQESKRAGVTHWAAAMETSLVRLLQRLNVRFRPIGEEVDYYGPVRPFIASISDVETAIYRNRPSMFWEFTEGLEPRYRPVWARAA